MLVVSSFIHLINALNMERIEIGYAKVSQVRPDYILFDQGLFRFDGFVLDSGNYLRGTDPSSNFPHFMKP